MDVALGLPNLRYTGRPSARCLWFRSFSGGPRSEPDGRLSAHPALQQFSRAVRGWSFLAACTQDFRRRFGVLHYAYLLASGNPSTAWPPSPCGRLSRPPWRGVTPATTTGPLSPWDSRPVGDPAFVPVIRASATQAPRSSPSMPSLGIAPALEVRPPQRHAGAVPGTGFMRLSGEGEVFTPAGDWGSGNPALAISRGSPSAPPVRIGTAAGFLACSRPLHLSDPGKPSDPGISSKSLPAQPGI